MAKAGRGDDQYMVRFPPGLRDRIKAAAEANGRSMNSEIVARLDLSFGLGAPEQISEQEKLIAEQRDALDRAATVIEQTMDKLKATGGYVAVFARLIDSAAKGDTTMLDGFLEAARERPLPDDPDAADDLPLPEDKLPF